jgi:3-oxoacyl-[acyl-carrier protein] reductase
MIAGKGYQPDYCPMGRFAEAGEIADVVHFLSTSASSYMTGAVLDVNGGYYLS